MKKLQILTSLALTFSLLFVQLAFAAPTLVGTASESFSKNANTSQLRDFTVTQESGGEYIEEGYLKLILPDSLDIIFNDEQTSEYILIYGTALDNGKVEDRPELVFANGDKEVWIPILDTFADDEYMVLTRLYVEGFNSKSTQSDFITMQVNDSTSLYQASTYLSVSESSLEDDNEPEAPSDIELNSTEDGVEITWLDPTDLDLQVVEILRGVNNTPVSGTRYDAVGDGEMYYLDEDVEEGDTVSYILRASDGRNFSDNSAEYSITYSVPLEEEELVCDEGFEEIEGECVEVEIEIVVEEELETEIETETEEEIVVECTWCFIDIEGHWGEIVIQAMGEEGIVAGDPDGSFRPNDSLNRAEATTLMLRIYGEFVELEALSEDYENPFSDVSEEEWYYGNIIDLYSLDLVSGNPDGTFAPASSINRAEFLQMAMNVYLGLNLELHGDVDSDTFVDVLTSDWFYSAIANAAAQEWVSGYECDEGPCFKPAEAITRAEATQVLYNMFYGLLGV